MIAPLLAWLVSMGSLQGGPAVRAPAVAVPIAEARTIGMSGVPQQGCVQGVTTVETGVLQSGPGDFYLQDGTGGIHVQGKDGLPLERGVAVFACGTFGMYDELEPEVLQAEIRILGKARLPAPVELTIAEALDGRLAGQLIQVRGEVQRVSIGETRDVVWLGGEGPVLRVYLRRRETVSSPLAHTAPLGGVVEVTGILIPEERDKHQVRIRAASDIALVEAPQHAAIRWLRMALFAAGGVAFLISLWVALLRRAVRRQTAEIRRLMIEARQSEEAKSQFLANMSHEIRTPLNGILGMTELALESELPADQRICLETVRSSARALVDIVNDVLDLSRIEKGMFRLEPQPFLLRGMAEEIRALFEPQARQKGLRLELDFDPRLPETVNGDEGRIRQVLVNLLGNAVKFTQSGWARLTVAGAADGLVRFTVSDSGPGVPREKHKEIFRAFVQGDGSSTRKYGGAGLGLTISDHLVRLMGGELKLRDRAGGGAEFSFAISLPPANLEEAAQPEPDPRDGLSRGLGILVAEDNEINRRTLESLLRRDGHFPRFAANGAEAAEIARADRFDAILMDVQMPEVDGLEATRRIREAEANARLERVPIIGLTAHAFAEDAQRCFEAGMDGYLAKPYHIGDLRRLLAACAQRSLTRP